MNCMQLQDIEVKGQELLPPELQLLLPPDPPVPRVFWDRRVREDWNLGSDMSGKSFVWSNVDYGGKP